MTSSRPVSRAPVVVLIVGLSTAITLVLAAIFFRSPAPAVSIDQPGTVTQPRVMNVILRDYVFNPTPIVLVPGEVVQFNVVNGGLIAHEFVLGDEAVQRAWAAADAAATPPAPFATPPPASVPPETGGLRLLVQSGEQVSARYEVPVTGSLMLMCHLPGHVEEGMVGAVELQD